MLLRAYVAAVGVLAGVAAGFAATAAAPVHPASVPVLVLLGVLLCMTEFLQVRHYHSRGHGASHNLIEGVIAAVIFAARGPEAMLVVAIALAVADATRRNALLKMFFNTTQWLLAAACGSLVLYAVAPAGSSRGYEVVGVALACVAMSLVNHVAIDIVLLLADHDAGEPMQVSRLLGGIVGRLASNAAALVTGLTLVAAYQWNQWLLALGAVFLIGVDAAGRAYAALRADHARLEGMQLATHALATNIDAASGLPAFVAAVRVGYEVREVQLVLFSDAAATVYACRGDVAPYSATIPCHRLASALAEKITEPTRLTAADPEVAALLEAEAHSRVLAAPLRRDGGTVGMLLLFDRLGIEGFESGELTIAGAMAGEVVGFLERVDLLAAVENERRKLADILGSTSDGIFSVTVDGTITSWNAGLAAITGYPADEMIGTRHIGLLRARDDSGRDVLLERWHDLGDASGALPTDLQIVSSTGETVWLSCSYSRIPGGDNGRDVLVVVARNVTQARELERLKDDFVAVVSHELRTPLVPIKGWAQTLLNRGERLSEDQRRTAVQSILAQAQRMESLVLNILEASRIEAGRGDGDGVADVGAIAARLVEELLSSRPDRVVRVRPPSVPCQVEGSPVWVERAIANLVANAVKYSPDDEPIDIVISSDGSSVLVSVTDRGPGIPEDAQDRIFDRFERLEETRTQTGTGLGLYITRRLARALGGEVSVSSVPGAGSTFLLRLPVAPVALPSSAPAPSTTAAARVPVPRGTEREEDGTVVRLR